MDHFTRQMTAFSMPSPIHIPTRTQLNHTYEAFCESSEGKAFSTKCQRPNCDEAVSQMLKYSGHTRDLVWAKASTMPLTPSPTFLRSFEKFDDLPCELRLKIWHFSLQDDRIIEIIRQGWRWWAARTSQNRFIPQFLACRESAEVASREMFKCFGAWINPISDTIWINSCKEIDLAICYQDIYHELCGQPQNSGMEQETIAPLFDIKKLMVTWELCAYLIPQEEEGEAEEEEEQEEGEAEEEETNNAAWLQALHIDKLQALESLTFALVEYVQDESGRWYKDDRQLSRGDFENLRGRNHRNIAQAMRPKLEKDLAQIDRRISIDFKMLQKGNEGDMGALGELEQVELYLLRMKVRDAAEEREREEEEERQGRTLPLR